MRGSGRRTRDLDRDGDAHVLPPPDRITLRARACFLYVIEKVAPAALLALEETVLPLAEEVYREGREWSPGVECWEDPACLAAWENLERDARHDPASEALMNAILCHRRQFRLFDRNDDPWIRQAVLDTLDLWMSIRGVLGARLGPPYSSTMKPHNRAIYDASWWRRRHGILGKRWSPLHAENNGRAYTYDISRPSGRREVVIARYRPLGWRSWVRGGVRHRPGAMMAGTRAMRKAAARAAKPFEESETLFRLVRLVVVGRPDEAPEELRPLANEIGIDLDGVLLALEGAPCPSLKGQ